MGPRTAEAVVPFETCDSNLMVPEGPDRDVVGSLPQAPKGDHSARLRILEKALPPGVNNHSLSDSF